MTFDPAQTTIQRESGPRDHTGRRFFAAMNVSPPLRRSIAVVAALFGLTAAARAQQPADAGAPAPPKARVYADVGLGFATRSFSGEMDARVASALGATFDPGGAATLTVAFFAVPAGLPSLGFGAHARVSSGSPVTADGAEFFFNDYDFGPSVRYHPLSDFGAGLYVQGASGRASSR